MSDGGKGGGPGGLGLGGEWKPVVMRRLVDEVPGDPLTPRGWALGVLRRAAPHRAQVGRKQRVRLALGQGGRRRAFPLLRPAIAGVILIGFGAAASAAVGRWPEIVQAYHRLLAPGAAPAAVSDARTRRSASRKPARSGSSAAAAEAALGATSTPEPVFVPIVTAEPPGSTSPSVAAVPVIPEVRDTPSPSRAYLHGSSASWRPRRASARLAATAGKSANRSKAKTPPPIVAATKAPPPLAAATPSDASDDTTPVLEAMRALRVEGNPARARRLLASYLDRHPNGSLAEEALAMSIEAAVAHEDDDAAVLARKYVRRYPAGHFSAVARRTLDAVAGTPN